MVANTKSDGIKRKALSSNKKDAGEPPKRAKFGSARKNTMVKKEVASDSSNQDDEFGSLSDSEDGGAVVEPESKGTKTTNKEEKPKSNCVVSKETEKSSSNSRESHAKQKQLQQKRKAAKPLADELQRLKKLWEKLRLKSHVNKEERQKLLGELYGIIGGRIKDFLLKHDVVRAVQTAIKYSTIAKRREIAKELAGTYSHLAENKYAKFLIGKLLFHNDDEIRDTIIPEFYGKVRRMINHPEASWVLDDIYRGVATKKQKAMLLREWYGPEFIIFQPENGAELSADLPQILKDEPSKRPTVLKYLFDIINSLIQKKKTGFTMLHDAMLQYFLSLKPGTEEFKEFLEVVKEDGKDNKMGNLLKNMAFTESGARLACLMLAHGTAKDRRVILKAFKDAFALMSANNYGHMIILVAYDVIDDTVMTSKAIFPEILGKEQEKSVENIIFLSNNLNARKTILYLFEGPSKSLFPKSHESDLSLLDTILKIRETTSKKKAETRQQELIVAISPSLLSAIAASASDIVVTSFGAQFVTDALLSAVGDKTVALEAVAATARGDPNEPVAEDLHFPLPAHIAQTSHGGRMFKTLVSGGRFDKESGIIKPVDPPLKFSDILYPIIKNHIVSWATGPNSWTVLAMLEAADFSSVNDLKKTLRKHIKELERAAKEETPDQKTRREKNDDVAESLKTVTKSKFKGKKGRAQNGKAVGPVGNKGTQLVLEMLA